MSTLDRVRALPVRDRFLYWIREREAIRTKRVAGAEPPWTDDPILRTYRFCNVRRMDDAVSVWLLKNWYEPFYDHPNMLLAATIARSFNLPASLAVIGFPAEYDPEAILARLTAYRATGAKLYNGAYMVRGDGRYPDKARMILDGIVTPLLADPPRIDGKTMEAAVAALVPRWGFSTFTAGQVVADLRWAKNAPWRDRLAWASIGPGSRRGMNRFHGRDLKTALNQKEFEAELRGFMVFCRDKLPPAITSRLEAHDYQNVLCEMDGYERVLWGQGRKKELYRPGKYGASV